MSCISLWLSPVLAAWMTFGSTPTSWVASAGRVPERSLTWSRLTNFHWNLSGASLNGVSGLSPRSDAPSTLPAKESSFLATNSGERRLSAWSQQWMILPLGALGWFLLQQGWFKPRVEGLKWTPTFAVVEVCDRKEGKTGSNKQTETDKCERTVAVGDGFVFLQAVAQQAVVLLHVQQREVERVTQLGALRLLTQFQLQLLDHRSRLLEIYQNAKRLRHLKNKYAHTANSSQDNNEADRKPLAKTTQNWQKAVWLPGKKDNIEMWSAHAWKQTLLKHSCNYLLEICNANADRKLGWKRVGPKEGFCPEEKVSPILSSTGVGLAIPVLCSSQWAQLICFEMRAI